MSTATPVKLIRREAGPNVWLARADDIDPGHHRVYDLRPEIKDTEEAVGRAMLEELESAARSKSGDLSIILLGGRGAQAFHRLLGDLAKAGDPDGLISRLNCFMQDALAPLRKDNSFSFLRDFERLLGAEFFRRVKSFSAIRTDGGEVEAELIHYTRVLEERGGADIFFLGLGPEPNEASHLAYIRPGSGANANDIAGMIPVTPNLLDHHIGKFKAGGATVNDEDERECRNVTHVLTLGPAAILGARRIVQSVVDATTAPAKRASYRRVMETVMAADLEKRGRQLDENPGLWIRLHPNVRSLILPDVLS